MAKKKVVETSTVKKAVLGNWVTSLLGVIGSSAILLEPVITEALGSGKTMHTSDWVMVGLKATSILGLGLAGKDGRIGSGPTQ